MSRLAVRRACAVVPAVAGLLLALAALVALVALSPPAAAGAPGTWTDISGPVGGLLVEPRVARDGAGVLHVVWITEGATQDLKERAVAADGSPGAEQTLASAWGSLGNPAIVYDPASPSRLLVFAGGIRSTAATEEHSGLNWWSSSDGGAWALQPGVVSGPGGIAYSSDVGAAVTPSAVFQTWFGTSGVFSHRGLVNGGDHNVNDVGDYGYFSSLAYDGGAGKLWLVAAYNATDKEGLWAREIDQASGDGSGASVLLPQSATSYAGHDEMDMKQMPVPATGLTGQAGIIVAYPAGYPSATQLRVWRIAGGSTTTAVLAGGTGQKGATAVAAAPDGRAWVVWADNAGGARRVYASRSNVGATAWGVATAVAVPPGTDALWQLAAAAQGDGRLDVLAQASKSTDNRIYHTQLFAGLSVTVAPAKVKPKASFTATVTVKDAGAAVSGATVTAVGKTASTDGSGVAKLKLKAGEAGKLTVTVKKDGYATATAAIAVKR